MADLSDISNILLLSPQAGLDPMVWSSSCTAGRAASAPGGSAVARASLGLGLHCPGEVQGSRAGFSSGLSSGHGQETPLGVEASLTQTRNVKTWPYQPEGTTVPTDGLGPEGLELELNRLKRCPLSFV